MPAGVISNQGESFILATGADPGLILGASNSAGVGTFTINVAASATSGVLCPSATLGFTTRTSVLSVRSSRRWHNGHTAGQRLPHETRRHSVGKAAKVTCKTVNQLTFTTPVLPAGAHIVVASAHPEAALLRELIVYRSLGSDRFAIVCASNLFSR